MYRKKSDEDYGQFKKSLCESIDMDVYFNILRKNDKFWELAEEIVGSNLSKTKRQRIIQLLKEEEGERKGSRSLDYYREKVLG